MQNEWQLMLEELRAAGYTRAQVARETGMSPGAVSDLATGRTREPKAGNGWQIAALHKRVMRRQRRAS